MRCMRDGASMYACGAERHCRQHQAGQRGQADTPLIGPFDLQSWPLRRGMPYDSVLHNTSPRKALVQRLDDQIQSTAHLEFRLGW
jgi:hypothetical protein